MEATTLAQRVVLARELAGVTPRALGLLSGLDATHVRLIEDGGRPDPRSSTIIKLAATLGVTTDWLGAGIGEPPTAEQVQAAVARARATQATGTEG